MIAWVLPRRLRLALKRQAGPPSRITARRPGRTLQEKANGAALSGITIAAQKLLRGAC